MLRRIGILGVLLLALSGFVPAAWACAEMAQQMDCCPADQPFDDADAASSVVAESGPCCDLEPTPTRSVLAFVSQKEDRSAKDCVPDHLAPVSFSTQAAASAYRRCTRAGPVPALHNNHQQTYLLTGRLRL